jgi:hypothetical protein
LLKVEEEKVYSLIDKKGEKLAKAEERLRDQAVETARLIGKHGKVAAVAFGARRVQPADVAKILEKEPKLTG